MKIFQKKYLVPFVFVIDFLIILFMVFNYVKGYRNYSVYGLFIICIGISFGTLQIYDFYQRNKVKMLIVQIAVMLSGLIISSFRLLSNNS